ncbi:MAG TPA: hypothetical protein VHU83_22330 [Bryobacteraceae bacterium]|jgi:hypothetical protein|nr:hypothetical protein [Bryobacteraceae bacterium]
MKYSRDLAQTLRRLAETLPRDAATGTEQRLLAAFRARQNRPQRPFRYLAGIAACLALALAWFLSHPGHLSRATVAGAGDNAAANAFIALPYGQSDVPLEQAFVVRVKLQPSEWAALGVPPAPARANAIHADLLIGQDGVARAVRLVSIQ